MQHCVEIAEDFQGQGPQEKFHIFFRVSLNLKKVSDRTEEWNNIHSSRYSGYTTEMHLGWM
jgi:hypothetical protein